MVALSTIEATMVNSAIGSAFKFYQKEGKLHSEIEECKVGNRVNSTKVQ